MPRRRIVDKRDVLADPVYNSPLVTKFINGLMWGGKKSTAEGIFYRALQQVGDKTGEDPLKMFKRAIENVRPTVEVKSRRVGGSTYQVPMEVRPDRRTALGIRWLIRYASDRRDKSMMEKLASELIAASNGEGSAVKKREDVHRMADANKAFAHFRW